jgi:iron complex transport system substrate-binding protein
VVTVPPVFERQLLTYMRALHCRLGLLINFGAPYIRPGIKRMIL